MNVTFEKIRKYTEYSREDLANIWGYTSFHAIARGVVTPKHTKFIILFVTEEKKKTSVPYVDRMSGNILKWEGPTDHFAEKRMLTKNSGDEIHLFYRKTHQQKFTYYGIINIINYIHNIYKPSIFEFRLSL